MIHRRKPQQHTQSTLRTIMVRCSALLWLVNGLFFAFSPAWASSYSNEPLVIRIAVASNMYQPLRLFAQQYQATLSQPVHIQLIPAASGVLATQIRYGAPYHVFFSANATHAQRVASHVQQDATPFNRALLAYWHPNTPIDHSVSRTEALATASPKFAVAEPRLAPFGEAAMAALSALHLATHNAVFADNVQHAFTMIDQGVVASGFVALSALNLAFADTQDPKYQHFTLVDASAPISQFMVIIPQYGTANNDRLNEATAAFIRYLQAPSQRPLWLKMGFVND